MGYLPWNRCSFSRPCCLASLSESYPTAVIVHMPEGSALKKYLLGTKDITAASLTAFVGKYTAGELKPHLKTEAEPADNNGPVKVLTGTNFERIALDETKDVLVEFYAPWCGHCKQLAPIYEKLGEKFSKIDSVVIAKMDATANEVSRVVFCSARWSKVGVAVVVCSLALFSLRSLTFELLVRLCRVPRSCFVHRSTTRVSTSRASPP